MKLPAQSNLITAFIKGDNWSKYQGILELSNLPCFLTDPLTHQIFLLNQSARNLFPNPLVDSASLFLDTFFQGVTQEWLKNKSEPLSVLFNYQNQTILEGELRKIPFPEQNKAILLSFNPTVNLGDSQLTAEFSQKISLLFNWVAELLQNSPNTTIIPRTLEFIAQLLGCDQVWLYSAMANDTALINTARYGDKPSLPELLPVDYLIQYQSINIWSNHEPPDRELHQYAVQNQQDWMGILPLGEADARIGLLVLTAKKNLSTPLSAENWELLTKLCTTVLQYQQQLMHLHKNLAIQERENLIYRRIQQILKEGIILIAQNHLIIKLNPAAEAILGYTAKEAL
ncbi:MAG: PAS domain S-box protein, partial [Anaerolineales bacterium]